ncbi:MAG: PD-(D/E)XK nuclease family protein [Myxococcota bacterium]
MKHTLRLVPSHFVPRQGQSSFDISVRATEFFARLRTLAFVGASVGVYDHRAPWIVAALPASRETGQKLSHAPDVADLLQTLHWSGLRAQDVARVVRESPQARHEEGLTRVLEQLVRLEQTLESSGLCDEPTALSRCLAYLRGCRALPSGLGRFDRMVIDGVLDLTPLHWRILARLARLGLGICVRFPTWCDIGSFGEGLRNIEDAIQRICLAQKADFNVLFEPDAGQESPHRLRLLEHAARATPCPRPPDDVCLHLATNPLQEAHWIARQISLWQRGHGTPLRIAVAMPVLDETANALAATLTQYNVRVRCSRGKPLAEVPRLRLLLRALRQSETSFVGKKQSHAVAEPDFPPHDSLVGYVARVARLLPRLELPCSESDDERERVSAFLEHMSGVLHRVPSEGSRHRVSLAAFATWLEERSRARHLSSPSAVDDAQVQIVPFARLVGQTFDYVVFAGLVQGRCPRGKAVNPLLTDKRRSLLRKLLGRDVFASGPAAARMAEIDVFDRLYFTAGLLNAREGVVLSTWSADDQGRNVSPGILFHQVRIALGRSTADLATHSQPSPPLSLLRYHVATARRGAAAGDPSGFARTRREKLALFRTMASQRAAFAVEGKTGPFAFAVGAEQLRARFGHALGVRARTPLTPSTIEALAQCRFRGFLQRLLKLDPPAPHPEPLPPKLAGQVAHEVLRRFYQEDYARVSTRIHGISRMDRIKGDGDEGVERTTGCTSHPTIPSIPLICGTRLHELVRECVEPFSRQADEEHRPVWSAYALWLAEALHRLVLRQALHPPLARVSPKHMELAIGVRDSSLAAVPIRVGEKTVYLGGVMDRVDEGQGICVVVDYKMASQTALSGQLTSSNLLRYHFQLPVYHRLLHHHRLIGDGDELLGYLLSIRDGVPSLVVGGKRHPHWRERVTQDDREDSLAKALERVLEPLWRGDVPADAGPGCHVCSLRHVCRVSTS